jgi:hypothetical protein
VVLLTGVVFLGIKYIHTGSRQHIVQTFSTKQNPAYKAVPQRSPLIIEIKNQEIFDQTLKGSSPVLAELKGIPAFHELVSSLTKFRRFVSKRPETANLLKDKSIIMSVNPSGKNQLSYLFLTQMNNKDEANTACQIVAGELGPGYTVSHRNYDNTSVYTARSDSSTFYFACTDGTFLISQNFILVEEAVRHTEAINLLDNRQFTDVYKTIDEQAAANIFINHQTIPTLINRVASPELRKNLTRLSGYSNWSALDLSVQPDDVQLNGYSVTRDSTDNYLNVFRNQEAGKLTIDQAVPANASYFVALSLNNSSKYIERYESYLRTTGDYYSRELDLMNFRKKTRTDGKKLMTELAGTQFAGVYTTINKSSPVENHFFVARLKDETDARKKLEKLAADFGRSEPGTLQTAFHYDGNKSIPIYKLPLANLAESLFGKAFSGMDLQYFTRYGSFLICGNNISGLKNYLQSLTSGQTLTGDSTYQASLNGAQPNPNFFVYARIPRVFQLRNLLFKPEASVYLANNESIIKKYNVFLWQFSVSGDRVKNRINVHYDPNAKEEPQTVWQLKLDGPVATTPELMLNHKDPANREIIVYDKLNHLSLIDREGAVLWTLQMPEPIVSDIHQIDLYHNNRLQYLFNTRTQLYLVDRLGQNVGKFPVKLKSPASNGVSVAEYGSNKEYRFFIAGDDHQIYAFDRDGKPVPKFGFKGSESLVKNPVQHFDIGGKDYLVFADSRNTYFLDRQGKTRDVAAPQFDHSDNRLYFKNMGRPVLMTTDMSGKIHIQDFAGSEEIKEVGKFSAAHRFVADDIDANGSLEYLFADGKKLSVFAADGKKRFERSFSADISETPFTCVLAPAHVLIGIVVKAENKIYLINKNGAVVRGFPLEGNTGFTVGKLNDANNWFNLIVGSQGKNLINYRLEF